MIIILAIAGAVLWLLAVAGATSSDPGPRPVTAPARHRLHRTDAYRPTTRGGARQPVIHLPAQLQAESW